ncbi:MAG: TonB-dependent receptor, partial [Bacteroidota bacterium]
FFFSRWGHMIRSRFHDSNNSLFGRYNNLDVDYWTPSNPTNAFPRPNQDQERAKYSSTMTYFEGDYVKLRNVTAGYRFTPEAAAKLKMSNLRIYASAQNPWFWAKYATYDPEAGGDNGQVSSGDIPAAKLFMIGVSVGF